MNMQLSSSEQRFRERYHAVGSAIADALPFCSLDLVGLMASYLQYGRLGDGALQWVQSVETAPGGNRQDMCMTVDARGRIWWVGPRQGLCVFDEDGRFITEVTTHRVPHALASSATHVYSATTWSVWSDSGVYHGFVKIESWDADLQHSVVANELPCLRTPLHGVMACDTNNRIYLTGRCLSRARVDFGGWVG